MNRDTGQDDRLARAAMRTASEQLKQAVSVDATAGLADLKRRVQQQPGRTRWRRLPSFGSRSSGPVRATGASRFFLGLGLIAAAIAVIAAFVGPHIRLPGSGSANPQGVPVTLRAAEGNPSALIVIADAASPGMQTQLSSLVAATARPGERLMILAADGGSLLSSSAPEPPTTIVPQSPAPLPSGATSYQKAGYEQAVADYKVKLETARAGLRQRQQQEIATWAAAAAAVSVHNTRTDLTAALASAALGIASLEQSTGDTGARVVVILGLGQQLKTAPTELPAGLKGSTIIASGFSGDAGSETAWQAQWRCLKRPRKPHYVTYVTATIALRLVAALSNVVDVLKQGHWHGKPTCLRRAQLRPYRLAFLTIMACSLAW